LFSLLGFAMALCHEARDRVTLGAYALLVLVCLLYPIYTSGLRLAPSIIGNVAALLTAIHVSMVAATRQSRTVPYLAPLLIWLAFVNVAQATACAANV
jgi:hypothetical protein